MFDTVAFSNVEMIQRYIQAKKRRGKKYVSDPSSDRSLLLSQIWKALAQLSAVQGLRGKGRRGEFCGLRQSIFEKV